MIRKHISRTLCALLLLGAASAVSAGEMTADAVITKNLEARGGLDTIRAIKTMTLEGTMTMGGMEAPMHIEIKQPDRVRTEFTMQGMTAVMAYDGTTGWGIMPFMGKTEPEEMPADQLKDMLEQSDIEGPLVDYADKGHKVEYLGVEEVEGTEAHKLRLTRKNGDVVDLFFDTEYFLEFRQEGKREMQGQEVEFVVNIGDYKEVGGMMMAHSVEAVLGG
ncbi:MAG: hypothetical protein AAF772_11765, partial [Acidobacteriota bacterium]